MIFTAYPLKILVRIIKSNNMVNKAKNVIIFLLTLLSEWFILPSKKEVEPCKDIV